MRPPAGRTLGVVTREWANVSPSSPAIFYRDRTLSYAEMCERADAVAKGLLGIGVVRGDHVGIIFANDSDWVVYALATSLVGAVCVPLNTWYKRAELGWTLRHAQISVLITADRVLKTDYVGMLTELLGDLSDAKDGNIRSLAFPALRRVVVVGAAPSGLMSQADFLSEGDGVGQSSLDEATDAVNPDSAGFILYTSGSTAEPKGVVLNYRGVIENGFELGGRRGIVSEDRVWLGSPLFYALGATNALPATFTRGASLVLQGHFEATQAIEAIEQTRATVYYATGNMSRAILDNPEFHLRRTGSLSKGNAGTMTEYKRLTLVELGISGAIPAYGLTECYGNATVGLPDDPLEAKLHTNGTPLPGMEMRIVDPVTGAVLPPGETGLVLLRGHTTPGYFDNLTATAEVVRDDGFFDTGDLGSLDPDGRFVFHSRLKDVLKSGGINVSPLEIEGLLTGHPSVRDAHVVGVADPVQGDRIVAFVDISGRVSERELQDYVKEQAASFKVPHHVFFRNEEQLPRLASGKVAKHRLAEEARKELGA